VKIGLYSITYLGIWYKGGALSLMDFIRQAKKMGFTGVEIDGKRPHGHPLDFSPKARAEIKAITEGEGLDMIGLAANNDFMSPVDEHIEAQLMMVAEQIKLCRDFGGKIMRLFLGWPGVTRVDGLARYEHSMASWAERANHTTRYEMWDRARACYREVAKIAENEGITLALQNHPPFIRDYRDLVAMIEQVDSPAFKACYDVANCANQDSEHLRAGVRAVGDRQVHCHYNGEYTRDANGKVVQRGIPFYSDSFGCILNYPPYINELKKIGYKGYICYEFCYEALDEKWELADRSYVDKHTAMGFEYMRDLLEAEGIYEK